MLRNSELNNGNNCEHNYVAIYMPHPYWSLEYIAGIANTYIPMLHIAVYYLYGCHPVLLQ